MLEWTLPKPGPLGAAHAASLILPADYCRAAPLSDSSRKNTLVLGIEDGCCAEIGVFLSHEPLATLEAKLMALGKPMFVITLDNKMHVSLVARSRPFDRACLPSDEQTARTRALLLETEGVPDNNNLNAMLWNSPGDGGTIQVLDVGGVRWKNSPTSPDVRHEVNVRYWHDPPFCKAQFRKIFNRWHRAEKSWHEKDRSDYRLG